MLFSSCKSQFTFLANDSKIRVTDCHLDRILKVQLSHFRHEGAKLVGKNPIALRHCPRKSYTPCPSTLQRFYFSLLQAFWLLPGQWSEEVKSTEEDWSVFNRQNSNTVVLTHLI